MTTHTKKYKGGYPQRAGMKVGEGAVEIASLVPLWIFRFLGWGDQGIAVTCQKQGWPGFRQGQTARWSIRMVWPSRTSFVDRLVTESLELRWMGSSLTHSWNCVARKTSLSEEKWAWIITEGQGPSAITKPEMVCRSDAVWVEGCDVTLRKDLMIKSQKYLLSAS